MKAIHAISVLRNFDQQGQYVFTKHDLKKLFPLDKDKAFTEGLGRLVKDKILIRACRGIYINPSAASFDTYTIEHIAKALRRGEYNYVSLESMLIEYGAISQILIDRLTVMTTGREGEYKTPYGVIEFTHTKRSTIDIVNDIKTIPGRPLRVASKLAAWRDLKRVGRNTDMVNKEALNDNR